MALLADKSKGFSAQPPLVAPASSYTVRRAYRFCRVPPYCIYRLCQKAQIFFQYVFCGVGASGVDSFTYRTYPLLYGKILCVYSLRTAGRAKRTYLLEAFALTTCFLYHTALFSNCCQNSPKLTSEIDLAKLWFFIMFFGAKSSIQMTSFSRTKSVGSLWSTSLRWLVMQ